ncbi:hypothetical protein C1Y08_28105 [Pseudomonas sp. FW306-02-F02-AA]|uniref:Uncharacterized protein n=1 Tax=Pseudomonas fluorescens TaxID=294 RepID=A0A0N9VUK4_PSEFL|nr:MULTISPECIES: hypothetical protein [Pseudomonas]ALI02251.1 hypothetical protein AO353_14605 [Pseudomonas fluorescens]PMZ02710.1 hypothetical protein C1Y07_18970 [Pseudomonas sp. FW306-02-F02-AB]PMZ08424.1 hypothetical protein C1Y06_19850 [Pseudomonas sp. FW306-02-H06C]PMZ12617.1 hypothetical protein C1Y08_28105 [Pseudomonas sp. FW306-02-F02-AA]PMZ22868.1 hypothetical protein C1Y09_07285 [Pseudomonas sp. FW306-02-F08-AA]
MFKLAGLSLTLAALTLGATAHADTDLKLGSTERVTQLFAYPNNCNVICYRDWTLEQTVEHYLTQSVQRDGYATAKVQVKTDNNQLYANISGVPKDYAKPLTALLDAGDLAHAGANKLNADGKWAYNWYLFLPLGMALENRKSVELLHFPPDYSLTQAQDYLESKTTDRWATLLTANGIAARQTPAYQTIIDIAPIAAPSTAGKDLEGVYGYFKDYQTTLVKQFSQTSSGVTLPMVAFGAPVRNWVKEQYGQTVAVLGLAQIIPTPGVKVPVLGSNHPSYIWYAADPANYDDDQAKADAVGLKVMGQDLSAACWQAGMGSKPGSDPSAQLNTCTQTWQVAQKEKTCELFYTSIRNLTPEQAATKCSAPDIKPQLDQLKVPAPALATSHL